MTPENDAPEWYLEGPGETRNGPYSIRQLQAFRREAKISDRSRVTSTYLGNQWRTIVEILGPSGEVTKNFSPPPRPEIERTSTALLYTTKQRSNINSAVSLLDTLHAARERKPKLEVMGAPEPEQNSSGIRKVVLLPLVLISVSALAWVLLSSEDSATKTRRTQKRNANSRFQGAGKNRERKTFAASTVPYFTARNFKCCTAATPNGSIV